MRNYDALFSIDFLFLNRMCIFLLLGYLKSCYMIRSWCFQLFLLQDFHVPGKGGVHCANSRRLIYFSFFSKQSDKGGHLIQLCSDGNKAAG